MNNLRFYSFVANHYLSPLQCGLQTAHVVGEMSTQAKSQSSKSLYKIWAERDKTIIILAASNHRGVVEVHDVISKTCASPSLSAVPIAIFNEDEDSMNGMSTAVGIILPADKTELKNKISFEDKLRVDVLYSIVQSYKLA